MQPVWIAFACGFFLGGIGGVSLMCMLIMSRQNEPLFIESNEVDLTITSSATDALFIENRRTSMTDLNMPIELREYRSHT